MGANIWAGVHFDEAPADAIPMEVLSKQFAWSFRYPGPDGKFGRTDLKLVNDAGGNPFGLDEKDPARKDDIVSASLKVPAGKPDQADHALPRRDPQFLRARTSLEAGHRARHGDSVAFPGRHIGIYEVPCSELCGLGHFQMRTTMQVMSEAEFEQWKLQQAQK